MVRIFILVSFLALFLQTDLAIAGSTGSEEMKSSSSKHSAGECFEGFRGLSAKTAKVIGASPQKSKGTLL